MFDLMVTLALGKMSDIEIVQISNLNWLHSNGYRTTVILKMDLDVAEMGFIFCY